MPARVIKYLIIFGLIGAAVIYIVVLNSTAVTVNYTPSSSVTAPVSVILIAIFLIGIAVSGIVAFIFTTRLSLREWKRERQEKKRLAHEALVISARQSFHLQNFREAQANLTKVINENPQHIEAWIQLSQNQTRQGWISEAAKTLDAARRANPSNMELLFFAADTYEKNQNYTAALDCLMLILDQHPANTHTLKQAAYLAKKLKRYDLAIQHLDQYIRHVREDEEKQQAHHELAQIKLEAAEQSPDEFESSINEILNEHRDFVPALTRLADLKLEQSDYQQASNLLIAAFEKSGQSRFLNRAAELWLNISQPDKAVAAVKAAIHKTTDIRKKFTATVYMIHLLLHLEMVEEAARILESLDLPQEASSEQKVALELARSEILFKEGKKDQAYAALTQFVYSTGLVSDLLNRHRSTRTGTAANRHLFKSSAKEAPSPQLSTP